MSVVPEAKDCPAEVGQSPVAHSIAGGFAMLRSVDLDNESPGWTGEIDDVAGDRHLAPKCQAHQPVCPYLVPEHQFGIGHRFAHFARITAIGRWDDRVVHRGTLAP